MNLKKNSFENIPAEPQAGELSEEDLQRAEEMALARELVKENDWTLKNAILMAQQQLINKRIEKRATQRKKGN